MPNTKQQQNTIDAPLGNILVSAAAGSGKTSVMTERIVKRILNGDLDIRRVLVMTFTDAAAKSMRAKIDKKLRAAIAEFGENIRNQDTTTNRIDVANLNNITNAANQVEVTSLKVASGKEYQTETACLSDAANSLNQTDASNSYETIDIINQQDAASVLNATNAPNQAFTANSHEFPEPIQHDQNNTISTKKSLLAKQLAYLGQSSISTIHAFCLDVVRNFYYEATNSNGKILLEPGFRIEEQGEAAILLAKALETLFEKYYERCDNEPELQFAKDFLFLVDAYGSQKDDEPVRNLAIRFYHFLRSMPDYKGWIESQKELIKNTISDFDNSKCFMAIREGLELRVQKATEDIDELREILSGNPDLYKDKKKNQQALSAFGDFIRYMEAIIAAVKNENAGWDDLYDVFQTKPQIPNLRKTNSDSEEKIAFMDLFASTFAELLYYITGEFGTAKYESSFVFAKCFVFTKTKAEIVQELETMQPALEMFFEIILDLDEEYSKLKHEANMIDFGDFEHLALKILKTPSVGAYYREKYTEIYLDEYQDTSSIQEALLTLISKGNCFMVGDVKQSIYKFRHARPQIFMGKKAAFSPSCNIDEHESENKIKPEGKHENRIENKPGDKIISSEFLPNNERKNEYENEYENETQNRNTTGTIYELSQNFRSVKGVLDAVNDVFYQIMSIKAGEIDYMDRHSLVHFHENASDNPTPVEILLVDISQANSTLSEDLESQDDEQESNKESSELSQEEITTKDEATKYQKEALIVALKIKELLTAGNEPIEQEPEDIRIDPKDKKNDNNDKNDKYDKKETKRIRPKDIVILARTKSICAVFADTIKSFGFPVEQEQNEAFLERYELKVIEALLIILDNPMQDIPLVSVMRSPLFQGGFSEEELLDIRITNRETKYFYECCELYANLGQDNVLKGKLQEFYLWIKHFRDRLSYLSVSELIETVYVETGFLAYASAMPDGTQRVLSLQQFQDWARGFDLSRQAGLYSFVRYMEEIHEKTQGQSPFSIEQSQSDSIKVMTMHKSKGLEYEVVFIVGNNRKMTSKDTQDSILVSEEFGVGFHYVDVVQQFKYPTPLIFAMREGMRNTELAEEMRLLYVAMTRAEGRLYITGTCSNKDNECGKGLAALIERVRKTHMGLPLPPHVVLSAKSALEWIIMSIARNPNVDLTPLAINQPNKEADNLDGEVQTYVKPDAKTDLFTNQKDCNFDINKVDKNKGISDKTPFYSKSWSISVKGYGDVLKEAQGMLQNQEVNENADKYSSDDYIKSNNEATNKSNGIFGNMSNGINDNKSNEKSGDISNRIPGDLSNGISGKTLNGISSETIIASNSLSEEMANQLYTARFEQQYPYAKATSTPLKISVSEIKRREQEQIQDQNQVQIELSTTLELKNNTQETNQPYNKLVNQIQETGCIFEKEKPSNSNGKSIYESETSTNNKFINNNFINLDENCVSNNNNNPEEPINPFRSINTTMKDLTQTTKTTLEQREIGITVHSFFRYMDIKLLMQNPTPENIVKHMDLMLEMGMLQQLEHSYLLKYTSAFEGYLKSNLASRIYEAENRDAKYLFREIPFTIKLDCKSLFGEQGFAQEDATFVQGMIDCWFIEDGKAVLVDYKTDMIKGDENQIRKTLEQRYSKQLSIYAQAITKITGLEVKESIIWLVDSAKEFRININEMRK